MKKIYKQLSQLKIDPQIEPMEVTESEKNRVKNLVVRRKRKNPFLRNFVAAAAIVVLSTLSLSIAFPATASQFPVIGSLFALFEKESSVVSNYEEISTTVDLVRESNGVEVALTDAVYDGESVMITYTIKSDKDLGENPILDGQFIIQEYNNKDQFNYMPGRVMVEKISDNEYAGLFISYLMTNPKPEGTIQVSWLGEEIIIVEDRANPIQGEWAFELEIDALDKEEIQLANHTVTDQGVQVSIEKMVTTSVSNVLYLTHLADDEFIAEWEHVSLDFNIRDDLGNEYDVLPNAGYGSSKKSMAWRIMTPVFDEAAATITVTPLVKVTNNPDEGFERYTLKPIEVSLTK